MAKTCKTKPVCPPPACPVISTTECVFYLGRHLPNLNVSANESLTSILAKIDAREAEASTIPSGTTAVREALTGLTTGYAFWDTDLELIVFYNAADSTWRNAAGGLL